MGKPLIIIGAGDHAKVLLDILLEQEQEVIGLADKSVATGTLIYGIPVIGDDNAVMAYKSEDVELVNGIGSVGSMVSRAKIYEGFKSKGYHFKTVVHESAVVSNRAELCEGAQVLAGAIVTTDAKIGEDSIINTNASVDHACTIGRHCHIAPGCVLCGCVTVGDRTHIGTGSSIIQGITIGSDVLIGAGSVVIKNIEDSVKVYGVPAAMRGGINMFSIMGGVRTDSVRNALLPKRLVGGRYA